MDAQERRLSGPYFGGKGTRFDGRDEATPAAYTGITTRFRGFYGQNPLDGLPRR
ncbi:MAG: hypothetical protein E1N59_554 [Puniceicoccaceae bacterium 5H]|nr:MAG: hypothetical protein E1N59_554 [Puniceicoccaceae bacterium 5H]